MLEPTYIYLGDKKATRSRREKS